MYLYIHTCTHTGILRLITLSHIHNWVGGACYHGNMQQKLSTSAHFWIVSSVYNVTINETNNRFNKQTKHTVKTDTYTNKQYTCTLSQTTPPRRSRGTLEIERYKSQVSLALEKAEERLRTSWHCRVLELFTGEGKMVGERVSSGFHESVSTLLGNQVRLFTAGLYIHTHTNQRVYKASA